MKRLRAAEGYTIIETMLFLVITGVLLASALLVFNGRQRRTEFTQGVREVDSQIKGILNETTSGYYPNKGDIGCTSSGGGGPQPTSTKAQGQNQGCIFLGRVLQFTTGDTYTAYTVVGQQTGADGRVVTSLGTTPNTARQTLLTKAASQPDFPDAEENFELPWGITIDKIVAPDATPSAVGGFGFITTLGNYGANGSDLVSGSSSMSLLPLLNTGLSASPQAGEQGAISSTQAMTDADRDISPIILCMKSAGGDRKAAIIIGGNNNNVGTEVFIDQVPEQCNA